jgi:putative transposase
MARIARVVAPGLPHHITQRGNRRQQIFFVDEDYLAYLSAIRDTPLFFIESKTGKCP